MREDETIVRVRKLIVIHIFRSSLVAGWQTFKLQTPDLNFLVCTITSIYTRSYKARFTTVVP